MIKFIFGAMCLFFLCGHKFWSIYMQRQIDLYLHSLCCQNPNGIWRTQFLCQATVGSLYCQGYHFCSPKSLQSCCLTYKKLQQFHKVDPWNICMKYKRKKTIKYTEVLSLPHQMCITNTKTYNLCERWKKNLMNNKACISNLHYLENPERPLRYTKTAPFSSVSVSCIEGLFIFG